jgi:hypothetical protein
MSDILDEDMTPDEAFNAEFEFKGKELQPFSEGRRSVAFSIGVRMGGDPGPTITDMHAIIFICLTDKKELSKAHRNPDAFWEKVLDWADANVTPQDYETEGNLVAKILKAAFTTRVKEITEPGSGGDMLGN